MAGLGYCGRASLAMSVSDRQLSVARVAGRVAAER
jgi:hypothetical protein